MHTVYQIRNIENGKRYFGMTGMALKTRWNCHKTASRAIRRKSYKSYLHNAMAYHGIEKFHITPIHECETRELAAELEQFIIEEAASQYPNGYNLRSGGEGGHEWHELSKERARRNTTEYFAANPDALENLRQKSVAMWEDPEFRANAIAGAKARGATPEGKERARIAQAATAAVRRSKRELALREGTATRWQVAQELIDSRKDMSPEERKVWHTQRMISGGVGKHERSEKVRKQNGKRMKKLWAEKGKTYFGHAA